MKQSVIVAIVVFSLIVAGVIVRVVKKGKINPVILFTAEDVTQIDIRVPEKSVTVSDTIIKSIKELNDISSVISFAGQFYQSHSDWKRVDYALSYRSFIVLDFKQGDSYLGGIGFSADFKEEYRSKDAYGIGATFIEVFGRNGEHYKRPASMSDIRKIIDVIHISQEEYERLREALRGKK
jgi:hypothetical protein